jgi:hypothetical protein
MSINASELQYKVPRADPGDETIATVTTEIAHDVSFYILENSLQLLFRLVMDFTELPVCISRGSPRASNTLLSVNRIINMKLRTANVKMSGPPWSASLLARRPPLFCLVSNALLFVALMNALSLTSASDIVSKSLLSTRYASVISAGHRKGHTTNGRPVSK